MRTRTGWVVLLMMLACGRTEVIGDPPPVAIIDANPRALVARELVTLSGQRSFDRVGEPLSYAWEIAQRPPGSVARVESANAVRTQLRPDRAGTWRIALVVTAGARQSEAAFVSIEVRDEVILPVANAGDDQRGFVGDLFTLNGSQSRDPAGASLSYEWSMARPPGSTANLFGATTITPTFIADRPGTYLFTLQVKARNLTDTDDMLVIVGEQNHAPIAVIAPIPDGEVGRATQLDGTGSSDPDGEPITYEWRANFPPGLGTLINTTSATPSFTPNAAGFFSFELVVRDRGGLTGRDQRTMTVRVPDAGQPPFDAGVLPADAGALDVLDPAKMYLAGTLSPGACDRAALIDLEKPDLAATGFACGFINNTSQIRPTDGRMLYQDSSDYVLRSFRCDACPYRGQYPTLVIGNDPVIPGSCPGTTQIGAYRVSPDGEILHTCSATPLAWRNPTGAIQYQANDDRLIALGADGWILTDTRLVNPRLNITRTVVGVTPRTGIAWRWVAPGAFFMAVNDTAGTSLWRIVVATGMATFVGMYPPLPIGAFETSNWRLGPNGALYRLVREPITFVDAVVRCTVGGTCEVVNTEATNPLVKLSFSSLVTGP